MPIPYPLSDGKITGETYGGKLMIYHAPWSFLCKLKCALRETVRAALGTVYGQKNKESYFTSILVISVNCLVTSPILRYSCRVTKKISDKFHLESPTTLILLVIFAGMQVSILTYPSLPCIATEKRK